MHFLGSLAAPEFFPLNSNSTLSTVRRTRFFLAATAADFLHLAKAFCCLAMSRVHFFRPSGPRASKSRLNSSSEEESARLVVDRLRAGRKGPTEKKPGDYTYLETEKRGEKNCLFSGPVLKIDRFF